ncbi:MAG TPA: NAD(P)/FAD-dependent oxidoreductase [Bdellovibrionota bacterium]|jgi:NADH dehydrogenase
MPAKNVIIVGAGFAGLHAAKALGRKGRDVTVTVIDRRNYHLFQPLLYQVAMAALSPADIAYPIRSLLSGYTNSSVLLGEVKSVDLQKKEVEGDFGRMPYDFLLLATGASHSYFGHEEWEEFAPGLKTLEQATEIRRRVLTAFELAERESDPEKQKAYLTFAIIGGGPTGVEVAGALGEISRFTLEKDFRHIDPRRTRVVLIEAGKRVLSGFSPVCSAHALRDLEKLGVSVWTNTRVTSVTAEGVAMNGEFLSSKTVIWAAGVQPSPLNKSLAVELDRSGRVKVNEDLSLPGHPEVFVVGDQALVHQEGKPLPGLAPVAMQEGRHAAANILRLSRGQPTQPFRYADKGTMATIGRSRAVVELGRLKFYGLTAWLTWLFVHIYYLIGFKNRVFVLLQWTWSYLTFRRGARLIVQKSWKTEN